MKRLIKVQYKRRRQNKTDYLAREELLKSGIVRFVVRKTNRYIIIQIVESKEAQDMVVFSVSSKDLMDYDYPESFSIKNIGAAYLTGYLAAKKALKNKISRAILDQGLVKSTKGSKIYAAVAGAIAGGLDIPCDKEMFPKEERLKINELVKVNIDEEEKE